MCNEGRNDQGIRRRRYLKPSWMAATLMDAAFLRRRKLQFSSGFGTNWSHSFKRGPSLHNAAAWLPSKGLQGSLGPGLSPRRLPRHCSQHVHIYPTSLDMVLPTGLTGA
jgi:hypothetical protein